MMKAIPNGWAMPGGWPPRRNCSPMYSMASAALTLLAHRRTNEGTDLFAAARGELAQ